MSEFFRSCARAFPDIIASSSAGGDSSNNVVMDLIQPDSTTHEEEVAGHGTEHPSSRNDALSDGGHHADDDALRDVVAMRGADGRVDPRLVNDALARTRALLEGPQARAIRLSAKREEAITAKQLNRLARELDRAKVIEERTRAILATRSATNVTSPEAVADPPPPPQNHSLTGHTSRAASAPSVTWRPYPLSTAALDSLPLDEAIAADDVFRMLRIEELRRRKEHLGVSPPSIVTRYITEDAAISDRGAVAKAEALLSDAYYSSAGRNKEQDDSSSRLPQPGLKGGRDGSSVRLSLPALTTLVEERRRSTGGQRVAAGGVEGTTAFRRLGVTSIDEDVAELRANEKATSRIDTIRRGVSVYEALAAANRMSEEKELAERRARAQFVHEERQRALDETRYLALQASRRTKLLLGGAAKNRSTSGGTSGGFEVSIGRLQGGTSFARARPIGMSGILLGSDDEPRRALGLARQEQPQQGERREHPLDAYHRHAVDDLLRDRGCVDGDPVAARTAHEYLVRLAADAAAAAESKR